MQQHSHDMAETAGKDKQVKEGMVARNPLDQVEDSPDGIGRAADKEPLLVPGTTGRKDKKLSLSLIGNPNMDCCRHTLPE